MDFLLSDGSHPVRQKGSALAVSLLAHAVAIFVVVIAPGYSVPQRGPSEYRQKFEDKASKIVWYKFRKELPPVKPALRQPEDRPLRAEIKAPQSMVSSAKDAPKRTQMVWTPAPERAPAPLLESPNVLAIRLPPKQFVAPPSPLRVENLRTQEAPEAPTLKAAEGRPPDLQVRLPPKPFEAPPQPARITVPRVIMLADPPPLTAGSFPNAAASSLRVAKLPPRAFTAPPSAGIVASKSVAVDTPPALDLPANSRDLNVAIVGLNPLDKMAPAPTLSSRADFSAGPRPRARGAVSEVMGGGLSVPDLFVKGALSGKPDLIAEAYASPTSAAALRAAMRDAEPVMTVHVDPSAPPHNGGATKVSGAPDARFNGRDVYLMAIQMPNLTSYSGSWLMWYSGRTARETGLAPIAAPVPHRKVDPKYVATAVEERVEGRVQLACVIDREGRVSAVEVVRGLDDRLNESARNALAKWEFYPALREGNPVEVDVLVEIPFRLAPRVAGR